MIMIMTMMIMLEVNTFEIAGLSLGTTTFTLSIMHQGHADYTSLPILVTVVEEEHLKTF